MKKTIAILLCMTTPSWGTWSLIQHPSNASGAAGTTCVVTTASTGSGHLLIAVGADTTASGTAPLTSMTNGCSSTWTHCPNCASTNLTAGGTSDMYYCLNSASGVTSITLTATGANSFASCEILEYSASNSPPIFDTSNNRSQTSSVTSVAGVALTLGGANDVIAQASYTNADISAITAPFFSPEDFPNGNAVVGSTNTASGSAPTYTQTSGQDAMSAIAFEESPSKGCPSMSMLGVGCP